MYHQFYFLAVLSSLVLAKEYTGYSLNGYTGTPDAKNHLIKRDFVELVVDGGWYDFQFRDANSTVRDIFRFRTLGASTLKITDNYCAGDVFEVWDNDERLGTTNMVYTNECLTNTTNPDRAYGNDNFSHAAFNLEPGYHKIKIRVLKSPFTAGSGAIRVDSLFMGCVRKMSGFTIISTPVPFFAAQKACRSFGLRLADIDIMNFMDATNIAFQCSGAFSQTWIRSYWGNTYGGSCMALSTGNAAPGGSINVPQSCEITLPVLCQEGYDVPTHDQRNVDYREGNVQHHLQPQDHDHHGRHHHHRKAEYSDSDSSSSSTHGYSSLSESSNNSSTNKSSHSTSSDASSDSGSTSSESTSKSDSSSKSSSDSTSSSDTSSGSSSQTSGSTTNDTSSLLSSTDTSLNNFIKEYDDTLANVVKIKNKDMKITIEKIE